MLAGSGSLKLSLNFLVDTLYTKEQVDDKTRAGRGSENKQSTVTAPIRHYLENHLLAGSLLERCHQLHPGSA